MLVPDDPDRQGQVARALRVLTVALGLAAPAAAQMGDRAGEEQPPLPPELVAAAQFPTFAFNSSNQFSTTVNSPWLLI